jgi:hypothetical protein
MVNDPNEFKFMVAIEFNLATNGILNFTLTLYERPPRRRSQTLTQSI